MRQEPSFFLFFVFCFLFFAFIFFLLSFFFVYRIKMDLTMTRKKEITRHEIELYAAFRFTNRLNDKRQLFFVQKCILHPNRMRTVGYQCIYIQNALYLFYFFANIIFNTHDPKATVVF